MIARELTTIEVEYPAAAGRIRLRGDTAPLSWERSLAPARVEGSRHLFQFPLEGGTIVEFKVLRDERDWSRVRDYSVLAGDTITISPHFDRAEGRLDAAPQEIYSKELHRKIAYRLWLPPSYEERPERRYPVLYVQDGHAAFTVTIGEDEAQSFRLDETLERLLELSVVEEIIVVGVHTDQDRIATLSPTRDEEHGGGGGARYLSFLVDRLKPTIDQRYRTRPGRDDTAIMGASMGGLFSFYAAWSRPDVFGKMASMSGSFWWDRRAMVRTAQRMCPTPRPILYIDSGSALDPFENNAGLRDGLEHTVALRDALASHCYVPGVSLHMLAFPGLRHDGASWAARLAVPLQLLFPRRPPVKR